ncbi:recombinase family protein [Sphingomonas sp. LB-2]|uniref:recombinase family protein n=1 Tax=Sphingomonas caeni TaxID=2984949 RepID=UPI002232BBFA|nr:recombinase family protein [Sphingomonas caeni]MCW3847380.1 recombinase family protein [Sphingomonas caeni]
MRKVRCAIYTRKSSEDGLEQSFNSLHAQREACAAYILSQASEGWSPLPDEYDDGGLSGGTLERPALQRLLADITAGKIDIVVVYKVDRLTRSLLDFSTLVQAFDAAGTSFVSITQSFNTTTSMGRLTLNMLLSFAQFEREVTAERIRDKIAASKAKGMWMGGTPPIGYKPAGRTLEIVEEHAAIIQHVFKLYFEVGTVRALIDSLAAEDVRTPERQTADGRIFGGGLFSRGQLYSMLKNPIYVGDISHKGEIHAGQHPPIIDRALWDQVQQQLADHVPGQRQGKRVEHPSLLARLIVDDAGKPLIATHACKGNRRYRYYVSRALHHRHEELRGGGVRIPARELEAAVMKHIASAFDEPITLIATAGLPLNAVDLGGIGKRAASVAKRVRARESELIRALLSIVRIEVDCIRLTLSVPVIAEVLKLTPGPSAATVDLHLAAKLKRSGKAVRFIQTDGRSATAGAPDQSLIDLIAKARRWWARLRTGEIHSAALAREEGVTRTYFANVIGIAFLSPRLVEMIVAGQQPARVSGKTLTANRVPASWEEQQKLLG